MFAAMFTPLPRRRIRPRRTIATVLAFVAAASAASAQTLQGDVFDPEMLLPDAEVGAVPDSELLAFRPLREIALPGPLPAEGPRWEDGRIAIPVAGGLAFGGEDGRIELREPSGAGSAGEPVGPSAWGVAPDGAYRVTGLTSGWIVAEKRCRRCRNGWRRDWTLRVPGSSFATPLVTARRVYFGTTDNRVFSLKRRNGHRLWEAEVDGRASRAIALWESDLPTEGAAPLAALLVVPETGSALLALDVQSGEEVARFELEENEALVGGAVVTPGGDVVVARQSYDAQTASLIVLSLEAAPRRPDGKATVAPETAADSGKLSGKRRAPRRPSPRRRLRRATR